MSSADIRIDSAQVEFSSETLTTPLHLSRGTITEITYAKVTVVVQTRGGRTAKGTSAILLSDLWAFPSPQYTHEQKDAAMRAICVALARRLPATDDFSDPLQKWQLLEDVLTQVVQTVEIETHVGGIPRLAALNCLAPFDGAVHDGWARAQKRTVYALYTDAYLNQDLSAYLGSAFKDRYPNDFLSPRRQELGILYVVGVGDALGAGSDGERNSNTLEGWIRRDGLTCFKIKTRGQDPREDAQRIGDVFATAAGLVNPTCINLSVDPNEACADADFLQEMLDRLEQTIPAAYQALDYIEQPTGRDLSSYDFTLHEVSNRLPVIVDESLDTLDILTQLSAQGWNGVALKTCKGQTLSILAYCWARHNGHFVTVQDLTNPGLALVHSANLAANLALSVDYFECNSRQYMPHARPLEQAEYPAYFVARQGALKLSAAGVGLY